jgi:hypothetical protein
MQQIDEPVPIRVYLDELERKLLAKAMKEHPSCWHRWQEHAREGEGDRQ